jgi:hypothetical protein
MKNRDVNLYIDELVLHGLAPGERHRIGEAVRLELARLLTEHGVPRPLARGGAMARLDGGAFEVAPVSEAEVFGTRVAQQVYEGLGK